MLWRISAQYLKREKSEFSREAWHGILQTVVRNNYNCNTVLGSIYAEYVMRKNLNIPWKNIGVPLKRTALIFEKEQKPSSP